MIGDRYYNLGGGQMLTINSGNGGRPLRMYVQGVGFGYWVNRSEAAAALLSRRAECAQDRAERIAQTRAYAERVGKCQPWAWAKAVCGPCAA